MCVCVGPVKHTYYTTENTSVLVDISTKKWLQMNDIDLFSLFSGAVQHWRLFKWKSAPFYRPSPPASPADIGMLRLLMSKTHVLIFVSIWKLCNI